MTARRRRFVGRPQQGAAIVTALLVVTLASVVVSGLFWREHVAVRSVENRLALAQARWIERAALDWAKVILRVDQRQSAVDHLGETWAVPVLDTQMDETVTAGAKIDDGRRGAVLAGQIVDAQSRFNLTTLVGSNGMVSERHVKALRKLLSVLGRAESSADLIVARVQQSVARTFEGRVVPPQRPPLTRLADLLDVPGLDPAVVAALEPHAIVLPRATTVNVNTAGPEVMAAMVESLDVSGARRFVARRERTYFPTLDKAKDEISAQTPLDPLLLSVGSSFFLVTGVLRYDRVESQTDTLLERTSDRVEVVWQLRL